MFGSSSIIMITYFTIIIISLFLLEHYYWEPKEQTDIIFIENDINKTKTCGELLIKIGTIDYKQFNQDNQLKLKSLMNDHAKEVCK